MKQQIEECCRKLRFSRNIAEMSEKIDAKTNQEYLLKILEHEIEYRDLKRRNRLLRQANFYGIKTFDDYIFDEVTLPSALSVDDIKSCKFIEEKKNLIFYGNVGTGKTHLATAIGVEACTQGKLVRFFRTSTLVNQLSEHKRKGEFSKFLRQLNKVDLIVCDEWGYVPLDRDGAQLLFQVVSDSYERRSVILTTNLEFSKWANIFYDEQMTAAIIDRLVHHSHLLLFEGQSFRLKNSLMKKQ